MESFLIIIMFLFLLFFIPAIVGAAFIGDYDDYKPQMRKRPPNKFCEVCNGTGVIKSSAVGEMECQCTLGFY